MTQFHLGVNYLEGTYAAQNIKKQLLFILAANKSYLDVLFNLDMLFLDCKCVGQNKNNGIFFLNHGNFVVAFLNHEERYVKRNIKNAINLYRNSSSFINQYAKNNPGIYYKNGF